MPSSHNEYSLQQRKHCQLVRRKKIVVVLVLLVGLRQWSKTIKQPYNDAPFTGDAYVKHLLNGNRLRAQSMLRLSIDVFRICSDELLSLGVEPVSKLLGMDEQLAIFLYIVGQNGTNRQTQDRFQHSGETISRVFHHIIYLFLQLQKKYIVTPPVNVAHESILENQKFSPFFDRCIGAMDGCHVPAFVPEHMAGPYRNRKGMLSQNVLGVVDFDMKFTYMMVGWEGSAHDSRVLGSAMSEDFSIPNSSFYLADAGYSLGKGMLVPYRGVRYHLRENAQAGQRPANKEELFNLRHAMLRNVVERTFGTWKKRFPILVHPLEYSLATQGNLVLALAVLHNMIIEHKGHSQYFEDPDYDGGAPDDEEIPDDEDNGTDELALSRAQARAAHKLWRDTLAQDMWDQYTSYLQQRNRG
ncbi:hypothetical protein PSTG_09300 [Puccinia striiformis f. sp. tritici PST-78]|uniref:Uncharacterized protein n=2 Tax=Puccinia striiformis f. sp. tritici PST-78 TaxID=1165861 RepID=A0A0L0VE71_9BASI|nr:hypothetical protein PSTG_09300 [Puccinia striiformis f. sp. tritici PST-78]